jgi:hypothetical protein
MKNGLSLGTALILAAGLAAAGWFVGHGFHQGRLANRSVTVKGVSERDVMADLALWPISFVSTDDDLTAAQARIETSKQTILEFLERQGIPRSGVEMQGLEVTDVNANPYRSGPATSRFIIAQTLMVRSSDPEVVRQASQHVGELVEAGVVLSSSAGPSGGPTYLFTRLSDFKPQMIAEATAKAREAAEQFAQDSGSQLGGIRRANQGVFVILPRNRAPGISEQNQPAKTLRVVSTVEYILQD